jgi:hypothetical protein
MIAAVSQYSSTAWFSPTIVDFHQISEIPSGVMPLLM